MSPSWVWWAAEMSAHIVVRNGARGGASETSAPTCHSIIWKSQWTERARSGGCTCVPAWRKWSFLYISSMLCSDIKKMLKVPYFDIQNGTHSVFNTSRKNFNNPQNKTKIWARNSCLVGDKCHSVTRDNSWWSCWVWETSSKYIYHHQFLY